MRRLGSGAACLLCLAACSERVQYGVDSADAITQDGHADSPEADRSLATDVVADAVIDATPVADVADALLNDATTSGDADVVVPPACPPGTSDWNLTRTTDVVYAAAPVGTNPAHYPFAAICLPVAGPGQSFYLESAVNRGTCTSYDACETSLEIICHDATGALVLPQDWSGENFLNGAANASLVARLMFTGVRAGPITCNAEFFNHDHGVAGGSITVNAGSTFSAVGPLGGTAVSAGSGGGAHLSSAVPSANLRPVSGWHMPAGRTRVEYIGDIQVTECHVRYPSNASDPTTQCTVAETGTDATLTYRAEAIEEYPDGSSCHATNGTATTRSVDARTHHKMVYTAVTADHTPGCANVWHFRVATQWISGRSFMIETAPYGQGMVRPL